MVVNRMRQVTGGASYVSVFEGYKRGTRAHGRRQQRENSSEAGPQSANILLQKLHAILDSATRNVRFPNQ